MSARTSENESEEKSPTQTVSDHETNLTLPDGTVIRAFRRSVMHAEPEPKGLGTRSGGIPEVPFAGGVTEVVGANRRNYSAQILGRPIGFSRSRV